MQNQTPTFNIQPPVFVSNHISPILSNKLLPSHALLTRFNGRIDYINLHHNCAITTSNFAPNLLLLKSQSLVTSSNLFTITTSLNLPDQLLVFLPHQPFCIQKINVDFGQITDFQIIDNLIVIGFNTGSIATYECQINSQTNIQLQFQSVVQSGFQNIRNLHIQKQENGVAVLASSDNKLLILNIDTQSSQLKLIKTYQHNSTIKAVSLINDLYLISDQMQKFIALNKDFISIFSYNSRLPVQSITLMYDNYIALTCGPQLKIVQYNEKNQKFLDVAKVQQTNIDLIGSVLYIEQNNYMKIVFFNQVSQFFVIQTSNNNKLDTEVKPKFNTLYNNCFLHRLGKFPETQNKVIYVSQNGIDLYDYSENKILLRLELQNQLQQFNEIIEELSYQNKNNSNFIQDLVVIQIDVNNILLIISEFYSNETKFLLINNSEDYVCINLLQEDNKQIKRIPACYNITNLNKYTTSSNGSSNILLFYQSYVIKVCINLDNDIIVQFLTKQQLQQQIAFTNVKTVQIDKNNNKSQVTQTKQNKNQQKICEIDDTELNNVYISLCAVKEEQNYQNYLMKLQLVEQGPNIFNMLIKLETSQINQIYVVSFNNKLLTFQNNLVVYSIVENLQCEGQIPITDKCQCLYQTVNCYENKIVCDKQIYVVNYKLQKLELFNQIKKIENKYIYVNKDIILHFHEDDAYALYIHIVGRSSDTTRFGRIQ